MNKGRNAENGHEGVPGCRRGCVRIEVDIRVGAIDTGVELKVHDESSRTEVKYDSGF